MLNIQNDFKEENQKQYILEEYIQKNLVMLMIKLRLFIIERTIEKNWHKFLSL